MSNLKAAAPADKDGDKGRVSFAKVQRYWAGKRVDAETAPIKDEPASSIFASRDVGVQRTPVAPAVVVKKADPRLARLARTDVAEARDERRQRHQRQMQDAQLAERDVNNGIPISRAQDSEANAQLDPLSEAGGIVGAPHGRAVSGINPSVDEIDVERQARRERALRAQKQQAEEDAAASESEYETDDESEYASDSSDEDRRLAKPVFVTKGDRETVLEKEKAELEAAQLKEDEQKRKQAREVQKETAAMVAEMVDLEKQAATSKQVTHLNTPSDIDTDSDTDEEDAEFERWQRRELERMKREEAIRDPTAKAEKAKELGPAIPEVQRGKLKFMQKYYHKGAFFQTEADDDRGTVGGDAIYKRDFTGATGEDKFDKQALPAVMQVKKFGRAGRTKWTHLANEDTSAMNTAFGGQQNQEFPAGAYQNTGTPDVFMQMKQAAEAKGGGRPGSVGDGLSKPRKMRT